MSHEWSYVRSEFVILEGEKSLYSGKLSIKLTHVMSFIILDSNRARFQTNDCRGQVIETCVQKKAHGFYIIQINNQNRNYGNHMNRNREMIVPH